MHLFCVNSEGHTEDGEKDDKKLAPLGEKVAQGGPAGKWSWEAWSEQEQKVAQ